MNSSNGVIVLDSTKEKNEELIKKWSKINKKSNEITSLASSGFIVSLLSPFDFEGPTLEIITAVVAAVGFIMKKTSEYKLNKLNNTDSKILDEQDRGNLLTIFSNLSKANNKKTR